MGLMRTGGLQRYFGDRKFWRTTLVLAFPIAMQNLLNSSFSLVDTLMVSTLGDISLSAVGMAGQLSWLMTLVLFGFGAGGSIFIAQYWGVQDIKGIRRTYGLLLTGQLAVSLVFFCLAFFIPGAVIRCFNRDPAVVAEGIRYLRIAAFSYPGISLGLTFSAVLRSTERVVVPMAASLFTTVLNAVADYALILGKFGLPALGVEGAAIATVLSAWMSPVIILTISFFRRTMLIAPLRDMFAFSRASVGAFFRRAAPVIFQEGMWGLGTVVLNAIFANLGYQYSAAIVILRTFEGFAFAFFVGLCESACIKLGKFVGAGEIRTATRDARRYMVVVPVFTVAVSVLIILLREPLVNIFNTGGNISELTRQAAQTIMVIYAIEIPIRNIPYIAIVGIFRSGGDTKASVQYDLACLWLLSVPATFLAAHVLHLPFEVCFVIMYAFEDYLKTVLCIRHYRSLRWLKPVTPEGRAGLEQYFSDKEAEEA